MKIVLQICAGILLAVAVVFVVYHYAVVVPAERAAAWRAVNQYTTQVAEENARSALEIDRMDQQIRDLQPGSPCNVLSGHDFSTCNGLKSSAAKKRFVGSLKPAVKGAGTPCSGLSGGALDMCLGLSPEQQINFAKSAQQQKH